MIGQKKSETRSRAAVTSLRRHARRGLSLDDAVVAGPADVEPVAGCSRFDASIARLGTDALGAADEARVCADLATCVRCAEPAGVSGGDPGGDGTSAATIVAGATIAKRYPMSFRARCRRGPRTSAA